MLIRWWKRVWLYPLVLLFIVFEDVIYRHLILPAFSLVRRWHVFMQLHQWLTAQNRYFILLMFVACFGIGELLGAASFIMLTVGWLGLALMLYVVKTLLAFYAFVLLESQKEKLFSFAWFAWLYEQVIRGVNWIKHSQVYLELHQFMMMVRGQLTQRKKGWQRFQRLWSAARRRR